MNVVLLITAIWLLALYAWLWWDERKRKSSGSGYTQFLQQIINRLHYRCSSYLSIINDLQAQCKRNRDEADSLRGLLNEQLSRNPHIPPDPADPVNCRCGIVISAETFPKTVASYRGKRKPVKKRRK